MKTILIIKYLQIIFIILINIPHLKAKRLDFYKILFKFSAFTGLNKKSLIPQSYAFSILSAVSYAEHITM